MHIFIDESGAFIPTPIGRPKISAVVALVVPTAQQAELSARFVTLRESWATVGSEVKGSAATPAPVAQLIELLVEYEGAFAEGCIVDSGRHAAIDVQELTHQTRRRSRMLVHSIKSDSRLANPASGEDLRAVP